MKRVLSSILILLIGISAVAQNNKYSVGRLSGTLNVGELGNAIYSLPIEIPEGLSNINPNVSICYNSFSGYGDLGMGFYIDGLSEISRTNKNLFFDGVSDVIDYKNGTDFLLDGKRLIKIANNKYTVENELSAVVEYFKDGNYFELKKDGKTYRYHTEIFRLDGTATWNLWQVTDNFGNTIKYSYQGRIVNINVNNTYDIVFDYEFYENHIYYSRFGKQKEITTCLKQVSVKQKAKILRSYDIEYVERNGFRYISSITLKNAYGESLPPIKYEWDTEESYIKVEDVYVSNQSQSEYSNEIDFYEQLVLAGDINGDGLDDIILISPQYTSNSVTYINRIMFYTTSVYNGKVYFNYTSHLNIPGSVDVGKITKKNSFFFADYDGNGVKELVVSHLQDAAGKFKNIIIAFIENGEEKHSFGFHLGSSEMPKIVGADFKNNGKSQIFCIETKKQDGVYPVQMFSIDDEQTLSLTLSGDPKEIFASDFNGDNAADIIIFTDKSYTIFYNNGDGTFSDNNKVENENCIDGFYIMHNGDFNGDGLMDFLYTETDDDEWHFLINRGDNEGFFKTNAWRSEYFDRGYTGKDNGRFDFNVLDFDLDGKTDVVVSRAQYHKDSDITGSWGVYDETHTFWLKSGEHHLLNNVKGSISTFENDALVSNFAVGDFNGDGLYELINYGYDCYNGNKNDEHTPKWHIYFNTDIRPSTKKIISVADIYGTTKFNYTFLTDKNFYHKGENQTYPMIDVIAPLAVVSSTEETNGITDNIIKKYKYYNLTANVLGKGLLGFNKIECENLYTGETTTTKINSWNTTYYTPEKITQTVIRDTFITTTETEFSITNLGGKNFISFPSKIKETDVYGDEVVTQNTFNTIHGYLENTITYYPDGFFKQQLLTGFVKAGGIWQPQVVINYQMIPESKVTSITKQYQEYDAATGTVVKKIENYGTDKQLTTEYTYDEFGNLIHTEAYSDGTENFSTDFTYESQKLIQTAHSNPKSIIKNAYDEYGRLIYETDITNEANPLKTSFKYDGWGHLLKTTNPDGTFSATEYGWGDSKELFYYEFTRQTAAPWQKQWYDILGRKTLTETVGEGGVKIKINNTYDKFSNIINTKTLYGDTEFNDSYAYDNQNRITEHIGKNGSVTKYTYTKNSVTTETDGRKVVKKYDVFGNLLSTDDGIATIAYTYNSDCKPLTINAAGAEYSLQYDDVGNCTQLSDPDAGITKYEYDAWGNLIKQTDAEGNITEIVYQNGLLQKSTCGGESALYTYDDYGKLIKKQFADVVTEYGYDDLNRVKSETYTIEEREYVYNFAYNKDGLLESKSFPDGTTEYYTYDDLGNLTEIQLDAISVWKLTSSSLFERSAEINGKYIKTQSFDKYGFPVSTTMMYEDAMLKTMTYKFDTKTGNLMSRSGMFPEPESFEYDPADRLIKITNGQDVTDIDYSENGNILFKTGLGNYEYFRKRPHALESVDNTDTLIINPLQEIDYTPFNKTKYITVQYSDESETSISFKYDADHIRRKSVRNVLGVEITQYFLPDYEELGGYGIYQKTHYINSPDGLVAVYVVDPLGAKKLEVAFTDHLGSITALYKEATPTFEATYDAFGNRTITVGTTAFTRGYCGVHQHYPSFDIIDMGGRMYDPIVGRFLSPDPFVQDWENSQNFNRYSYCLNNPLKYTDPSGEFFQYILGGIFGGIQGFSIGKSAGLSGWKLFGSTIIGAGIGAISGGIANSISSNSMIMSNTLSIMAGSHFTSTGMCILGSINGVNIPYNLNFGFGSLSFDEDGFNFGFLGKKGNSKSENWGYFLGAMANLRDVEFFINSTKACVYTERGDAISHSGTMEYGTDKTLMSFGPNDNKMYDSFKTRIIHSKSGALSSFTSYKKFGLAFRKSTSFYPIDESLFSYYKIDLTVNKYAFAAMRGLGKILPYQGISFNCVNMNSMALWLNGIPNVGIHPYILHGFLKAYTMGVRVDLFSYYLVND